MPLEDEAALQTLRADNPHRVQCVFKHSTSCGLSGMMLRRFQKLWASSGDKVDFYLLDVIRHRSISNAIAEQLGVPHQSPQVILLDSEGVRAHASHGDIDGLRPDGILKNPA